MESQRFSSVEGLVDDIFADDDDAASEIKNEIRSQKLATILHSMRCRAGISQQEWRSDSDVLRAVFPSSSIRIPAASRSGTWRITAATSESISSYAFRNAQGKLRSRFLARKRPKRNWVLRSFRSDPDILFDLKWFPANCPSSPYCTSWANAYVCAG